MKQSSRKKHLLWLGLAAMLATTAVGCVMKGERCSCDGTNIGSPEDWGYDNCGEACLEWRRGA